MTPFQLFAAFALMLTSLATLNFGCATRGAAREVAARPRSEAESFAARSERAAGASVRGERAPTSVLPGQFDTLVERAREARKDAYVARPEISLPSTLGDIDWASYRTIRYRPERALWREQPGHFEAQSFHLGFIYRAPVDLFVIEGDRTERLAFSVDQFRYDGVPPPDRNLPLGYAGLRLHTNLNSDAYRDPREKAELRAFLRSGSDVLTETWSYPWQAM